MSERKGIQLCYHFEERRLLNQGRFQVKWYPPFIVQPKLDGERCRMIISDKRCLLLSSSEEIISSVPHINQAGLRYLPDGEYDGELYVHGWPWEQIHSVVSREVSQHPDFDKMQFHLFDIVNEDSQIQRLSTLVKLFTPSPFTRGPLHLVDSTISFKLEELYEAYDRYIDQGYEGFIIRHVDNIYTRSRTATIMKYKPKKRDQYRITGVYEAVSESGTPKGMVGGFNLIDDMGTHFSCGAGKLKHHERTALWQEFREAPESIVGHWLDIEFQSLTDAGKVPKFSRAVKIIR